NDDPGLEQRLKAQRDGFDPTCFTRLLEDTWAASLGSHPFLTREKVTAIAQEVEGQAFRGVFEQSLKDIGDAALFRGYLRSLVLHGLALSLHDLFVVHGRGDEHRARIHARLPLQFGGDAHDTVSVFETGDYGDGTTRTFVRHRAEAFATWKRG